MTGAHIKEIRSGLFMPVLNELNFFAVHFITSMPEIYVMVMVAYTHHPPATGIDS
jgi:hypothetical protein